MRQVAAIMAGGRGERFWPLSRQSCPKQFLPLISEKTMLQETVGRLAPLLGPEDIYVVTGAQYATRVAEQLPDLPRENIILEPEGRDTAPCIALTAAYLAHRYPGEDAVLAVLPADHLITKPDLFRQILAGAFALAAAEPVLVTIGMSPSRPETGYGYIKCGEKVPWSGRHFVYRVQRFTEKPDRAAAEAFLKEGGYLWNSGMFVWRLSTLREAFQRHLPEVAAALPTLTAACGGPAEALAATFHSLPRISIDYGVMEKADNVYVIPGDFGWDDVGTWSALARLLTADADENVTIVNAPAAHGSAAVQEPILLGSKRCVVSGNGRLVAALGVEDLIIVDTDDALLICRRGQEQNLKSVLEQLRRDHRTAYL
ncbi:MAG TPA: NTP transferase domain-containing protein [Firmicutes bacterium]|nr:NTP transferase domain-containing protein [Bacillota bacterium]